MRKQRHQQRVALSDGHPVDSAGTKGSRLDLGLYEELFKRPNMTFSAIGRVFGCTGENVRTIYQRHFAEKFPERNGRDRRRRHRLEEMGASKEGLFPAHLAAWKMAEGRGLSVRRLVTNGRGDTFWVGPFILIEGWRCDASLCTRRFTPSDRSRAQYTYHDARRADECDFIIVIQRVRRYPQRVFIVPSRQLRAAYPSFRFYVPLMDVTPYRKPSRLNWKGYESAWHLLRA